MDFAKRLLNKYGWKEGDGLGKQLDGIVKPLKASLKFDNVGLGADLAASDFNNHWWERVFNEAAQNVEVVKEENGVSMDLKDKDDEVEISTKGYSVNKLKKAKGNSIGRSDARYENFMQSATLTKTGDEIENEHKIAIDDIAVTQFKTLTDEELFQACGGRTAHKGARHGLKMNGKLSRLEQQEEEMLKKMQDKIKSKTDSENINGTKRKIQIEETVVDNSELVKEKKTRNKLTECNENLDDVPEVKKKKKSRRKLEEAQQVSANNNDDTDALGTLASSSKMLAVSDETNQKLKNKKQKNKKTIDVPVDSGELQVCEVPELKKNKKSKRKLEEEKSENQQLNVEKQKNEMEEDVVDNSKLVQKKKKRNKSAEYIEILDNVPEIKQKKKRKQEINAETEQEIPNNNEDSNPLVTFTSAFTHETNQELKKNNKQKIKKIKCNVVDDLLDVGEVHLCKNSAPELNVKKNKSKRKLEEDDKTVNQANTNNVDNDSVEPLKKKKKNKTKT